jgi:hypothetical protein
MIPAAFAYHRPLSLDETLGLLAQLGEDARIVAGGHSLIPMMKLRLAQPEHLVDLQDLESDCIRALAGCGFFPLVKAVDRHEASPALEGIAERRPGLDPLGLGVDIGEADIHVLGPVRDQTPAQKIQAALAGPSVIADHRKGIGWRRVPTGRKIWSRSMRRDREDELDLADIGGEADAATYAWDPSACPSRSNRTNQAWQSCAEHI